MKKIGIVIDQNQKLYNFLENNLKEIFREIFEFYSFSLSDMKPLDDMDLVLVMIKERIFQVLPYIKDTRKILAVNRTISRSDYEDLKNLQGHPEIVVVNDTVETTMELVTTFYKLGMSDIRFIPFNPSEVYEDSILAITANEAHLIPEGMRYIDLGFRPIDISTFIEIMSRLEVDGTPYHDTMKNYVERNMPLQKKSENSIMLTRRVEQLSNALKRESLERGLVAKYTFDSIRTQAGNMMKCIEKAQKLSKHNINVLIHGESGTGKELFAQAIHNGSSRRHHPFMGVNVTAIPSNLLESELFGYVEGAFTGARKSGHKGVFEQCSGGTLFLDEIGDMQLEMQGKLLRVLEERCIMPVGGHKLIDVDVRIVAATNKDLLKEIEAGRFRDDLYYRLKASIIKVPPLRERADDVIYLAKFFLSEGMSFSKETEHLFRSYPWKGNVRELKNTCDYIQIMDENQIVDLEDLPEDIFEPANTGVTNEAHVGVYANREKISAVLTAIHDLSMTSSSVGRLTIVSHLETGGWSISETEVKNILKDLKNGGFVHQKKGRKGAVLTAKGESLHRELLMS